MITYTETAFNMEARKVEPVARWAVETTAADLLTVSRNGEQKTVKIVPDAAFAYSLKKTYIRATGAHGNPHHTGLERQRIVDTIAHHHRPKAVADFTQHTFELVFGQCLRLNFVDAHSVRQMLGHALAVAGQQHLAPKPQFT